MFRCVSHPSQGHAVKWVPSLRLNALLTLHPVTMIILLRAINPSTHWNSMAAIRNIYPLCTSITRLMERRINESAERMDRCIQQSSILLALLAPSICLAPASGQMWRNIWICIQESNLIALPEHADMHFSRLELFARWFMAMHWIKCSYKCCRSF